MAAGGTTPDTPAAPAAPVSLGLNEPDDIKRAANWASEHEASAAAMVAEFNRVQAVTPRIKDYLDGYKLVIADALKLANEQEKAHPRVHA